MKVTSKRRRLELAAKIQEKTLQQPAQISSNRTWNLKKKTRIRLHNRVNAEAGYFEANSV
jgi:hypothetical protein